MHLPRAAVTAVAATGLALAALCSSGSTFANAQTAHYPSRGTYLTVNETSGRTITTSSRYVPAGLVNFTMTSAVNDQNNGFDMQVFALREHTTLAQFRQHLPAAFEAPGNKPDPAAARAISWINMHIVAYGGTQGGPPGTTRYQMVLPGGKYYVADLFNFIKTGAVRSFWAYGSARYVHLPYTHQALQIYSTAGGDRFGTGNYDARYSGTLDDGWLRVTNTTGELHFVEFQQVKLGTTNQEITNFLNGKGADPTIPNGGFEATDVISPYHALNLSLQLPPGRYVIICFIPDDMTGMAHAFMGMHLVVNVR